METEENKKCLKEQRKDLKKLISDYVEGCKARGDVDEDGKVHLFPMICETPDLILEQYPMTEKEILSVKEYNQGLLHTAIDFLHGDNKGKIASSMYLCVYAKYHGLNEL